MEAETDSIEDRLRVERAWRYAQAQVTVSLYPGEFRSFFSPTVVV